MTLRSQPKRQKMSCNRKRLGCIGPADRALPHQSLWQGQQLWRPISSSISVDGTPSARADIGQVITHARDRTARQIKPKADLVQQQHFPAQIVAHPIAPHRHRIHQGQCALIKIWMRIAFGQTQMQQRTGRRQTGQRQRVRKHAGTRSHGFDNENANLILKPRTPCQGKLGTRLQNGCDLARSAPPNHAKMAAMTTRENFDDRRAFAMRPHRQEHAFFPPFHARIFAAGASGFNPQSALRTIAKGTNTAAMQSAMSLPARLAALAVFVVAALSLRLQFDASHAALASGSVFQTLWAMAGYFTILTNGLVACTMALVAMRWLIPAQFALAVTLSIVMVGMVYHTLLAQLFDPVGLAWWADQGLHSAVPLLTLMWWIIFAPTPDRLGAVIPALFWPAAYVIYAVIRGSLTGFWPYPFLDVATLGWVHVGLNVLGMVAVFAGVGAAMSLFKQRSV